MITHQQMGLGISLGTSGLAAHFGWIEHVENGVVAVYAPKPMTTAMHLPAAAVEPIEPPSSVTLRPVALALVRILKRLNVSDGYLRQQQWPLRIAIVGAGGIHINLSVEREWSLRVSYPFDSVTGRGASFHAACEDLLNQPNPEALDVIEGGYFEATEAP